MTTPDLIASRLVDGPNPADRTLPLIDRVPMEQGEGVSEGGCMDVLTVTRKAYKGLIEAAVREALAERDAEVERLCEALDGQGELREGIVAGFAEEVNHLRAEVERLTAERNHHEHQQRVLLHDDLPKLRAERDDYFKQRCDLLHERDQLAAEVAALRERIDGHCERIAKQSELLSRRAEKPEAVARPE